MSRGQPLGQQGNRMTEDQIERIAVTLYELDRQKGLRAHRWSVGIEAKRACRKVCERGEKRADWLGLQAGLPSYGRRERQPRPAHPTALFKLCDRPRYVGHLRGSRCPP